jgi:hypothetical protein
MPHQCCFLFWPTEILWQYDHYTMRLGRQEVGTSIWGSTFLASVLGYRRTRSVERSMWDPYTRSTWAFRPPMVHHHDHNYPLSSHKIPLTCIRLILEIPRFSTYLLCILLFMVSWLHMLKPLISVGFVSMYCKDIYFVNVHRMYTAASCTDYDDACRVSR